MSPGVVELLCEAAHDHATRTIEAGARVAAHSNHVKPNLADLKMGVETLRKRAPGPVPTLSIADAARERNHAPLPILRPGVHFPPDSYLAPPPSAPESTKKASASGTLSFGNPPWSGELPDEYIKEQRAEQKAEQKTEQKTEQKIEQKTEATVKKEAQTPVTPASG